MAREVTHGKPSTYTNHACRCDLCRSAWAVYVSRQRARRLEYVRANGGPPPHVQHGYSCAHNWGCACEVCRAAVRERNALRHRRKPGRSDG